MNLKEAVLRDVIKVLLTEPHRKDDTAVGSVARIHTREAGYNSVGRILREMSVQPAVVDFAIEICLQKSKTNPYFGGDALSAVCGYIACGASEKIKNEVIKEMARCGWYSRTESLTRKYLKRDLTEEEAWLLVEAYLKETASRCTNTEEHLIVIARRCLPEDEAEKVEEQLREFKRKFDSYID